MKFRKKPVVIEATQWFKNGDHPVDGVGEPTDDHLGGTYKRIEGAVVRFFRHPAIPGSDRCGHCQHTYLAHGWIDTLEGQHNVCPGDWIITGIAGEYYPCKPKIFAATYEAVE